MEKTATQKVSKFLSQAQMKKHGFNENTTCSYSLNASDASNYMQVDGYIHKHIKSKNGRNIVETF